MDLDTPRARFDLMGLKNRANHSLFTFRSHFAAIRRYY